MVYARILFVDKVKYLALLDFVYREESWHCFAVDTTRQLYAVKATTLETCAAVSERCLSSQCTKMCCLAVIRVNTMFKTIRPFSRRYLEMPC